MTEQDKLEERALHKVNVVIEKDEDGYYAYCPGLEGCQTQGDTLEKVLDNAKEAIELYLETLSEDEIREFLSREILTTSLEVELRNTLLKTELRQLSRDEEAHLEKEFEGYDHVISTTKGDGF